jgi:hypothetical protein
LSEEQPSVPEIGRRPVVVKAKSLSVDDILRFVDRAPDEETERFAAAIYADRRLS